MEMNKPSDSCKYYHPWDCSRKDVCPEQCNRYQAYDAYYTEDLDLLEVTKDEID